MASNGITTRANVNQIWIKSKKISSVKWALCGKFECITFITIDATFTDDLICIDYIVEKLPFYNGIQPDNQHINLINFHFFLVPLPFIIPLHLG